MALNPDERNIMSLPTTASPSDMIPTQAHCSRRPDASRIEPVGTPEARPVKPTGGFWTSTLETLDTAGWRGWCRSENWNTDRCDVVWALEVREEANVLVIDSEADARALHERFGVPDPYGSYRWDGLHWEALAACYDGLRLTNPYGSGIRHSDLHPTFYTWDCESTVWFRWCFDDVREVTAPTIEV